MILEKDAVEALREYLPDYLRRTGRGSGIRGKIRCLNPGHNDREPSMGYDSKTKRLHCFGCGKSYDVFDVIGMDNPACRTFPEQVRKACELFCVPFPAEMEAERSMRKAVARSEAAKGDFSAFVDESVRRFGCGGDYFAARGISRALCEKYRLFQRDGRAYLPVYTGGRCAAYCARSVDGREPRYRNSPGSMALFGTDALEKEGYIVVAESVFDALSAEECGFPAVALCGVSNAGRFLRECTARTGWERRTLLLAGDCDAAGKRLNQELEQGLRALGIACVRLQIPTGMKDLNEALVRDRPRLEAALRNAAKLQGACGGDLIERLRMPENRFVPAQTGFESLDRVLGGGLYPGLYVLGAISSLGKTSFVLQMADAIAEGGRDVLYFTLEMSGLELISKSVSRISHCLDGTAAKAKALSMREVLRGDPAPLLDRAAEQYARGPGPRLFFIEDAPGTGEIRNRVERHIRERGEAPVVMVDYLQILKPADGRVTDKQNMDRAVVALKRLSRDTGCPVVAVSSFNRENYRNAVSMEAFKESGAVEYSSDVLLGMQLTGAGDAKFDVNLAKLRSPRSVEVVLLKNRMGEPYAVLPMRYYAKFSHFVETRK